MIKQLNNNNDNIDQKGKKAKDINDILTGMTSKKRIIDNLFNLVKSLKENTDDTIQKIFDKEKNIEQTNSLLNLKS